MSGAVDVLAVMDGRVASLACLQDDARREGNDHLADELEEGDLLEWREARAAVAELIEADKEYDAIRERRNLYPCPGMDEHFLAATKRRAAALARVQGGAR